MNQNELDHHSNINNPNNDEYQQAMDNHSDQLNPNNDAYWESRGYDERPDDWEDRK